MKTKIFVGVSLDGFIARKNGDFDWLSRFANEEAIQSYKKFISGIDAIVIGRGTFEAVLKFPTWPYNQPVFVLSSSIKQLPDKLKDKAILLSLKPQEALHIFSQKGFQNIYVDGGKVIQEFLRAGLVDEITISHAPVLIGSGIPLFGYLENDISFEHINTEVFSNGLVRSHYVKKKK